MAAKEKNVPIISSMGAGNKLDPSQFKVADIYKTKVCPLAKVMRRELKKRGVKKLRLFIQRNSRSDQLKIWRSAAGRIVFVLRVLRISVRSAEIFRGSVAFVPSVAGLIIAGEVIKDLTAEYRR